MTGAWPLVVFGEESRPALLDFCPLCGEPSATDTHAMESCDGNNCHRMGCFRKGGLNVYSKMGGS